jgi:hypothetical protein
LKSRRGSGHRRDFAFPDLSFNKSRKRTPPD